MAKGLGATAMGDLAVGMAVVGDIITAIHTVVEGGQRQEARPHPVRQRQRAIDRGMSRGRDMDMDMD